MGRCEQHLNQGMELRITDNSTNKGHMPPHATTPHIEGQDSTFARLPEMHTSNHKEISDKPKLRDTVPNTQSIFFFSISWERKKGRGLF